MQSKDGRERWAGNVLETRMELPAVMKENRVKICAVLVVIECENTPWLDRLDAIANLIGAVM